jgi:hypothetical protein
VIPQCRPDRLHSRARAALRYPPRCPQQDKQDSSFSEEKEAKRLLFAGAGLPSHQQAPRRASKSFFTLSA